MRRFLTEAALTAATLIALSAAVVIGDAATAPAVVQDLADGFVLGDLVAPDVPAADDGRGGNPIDPSPTTVATAPVPEPGPAVAATPPPPAGPDRTPPVEDGGARLRSTAYCLTGNMASGRPTYVGAVAANRYPIGTVLAVDASPWGPGLFVVEDRHAAGATELDFAMPGECGRALAWGNLRHVGVEVIG